MSYTPFFPNSLLSPQIRLHPKFGSGKAIQLWHKLFKKIVVEEPTTFMSKILDRLFPSKKSAPKIYVTYAISVCEYIKPVKSTNSSLRIRYQISYFKISTKSFE